MRGVPRYVGIPRHQKTEYMRLYRWLIKHRGPWVRTLSQLERALAQPEVFYIVPEEGRKPRPKPGDDAESEVLGCGLEEGTEEEAAAPRPPQASLT